ncbi:glutathione S-transferase theta-1-like isoform X2 [Pantherophis guttatus]|uniref:glutathione transferase n=2 Tax=Colubrinae TaxID=169863 RepID=A0A6P9DG68_PANGU|nr:glutathione S-transferase theta-1-like isoform X2 [Pantherophis guttatus]
MHVAQCLWQQKGPHWLLLPHPLGSIPPWIRRDVKPPNPSHHESSHSLPKGCPPGGSGKGLAWLAMGPLVPSANQMPEVSVGSTHLWLVLAMVLELYLDLLSQPCRAVYIFAKKNNIPFMMKPVEMLKGQHFTEEFNKVNILRKVPVLKDGDFILEESTAILLYLTRKYNTPSYWYPPDMKKRARVDEYLAWQISTIRAGTSKILWLKVVIPLFVGHQVSPEKLYEAMEELNLAIQKLEDKFLQDKPFLIGPEISLADLVAIVELMQPLGAGCDILEGRPKLQEWRKRVELTLGKDLFMEAHNRILNPQELKSIIIDPPLKAQMKPLLLKMLK